MILMNDIIREGHETLKKKAQEVQLPISAEDRTTLISMLQYVMNSQDNETASKYNLRPAVGLAAPQINVSKRMFAILTTDFDNNLYCLAVVNPRIVKKSKELVYLPTGEGCLSVDRNTDHMLTPRHEKITVEGYFLDLESNQLRKKRMNLSGYIAIVFQHEYDHLDGVLYTDKMYKELTDAKPLYEVDEEETEE